MEKRHNSPRPGVIKGMEQRRFFEVRVKNAVNGSS